MSRRRLIHGKAARTLVDTGEKRGGKPVVIAVRGNVDKWRAERGIRPKGKRR